MRGQAHLLKRYFHVGTNAVQSMAKIRERECLMSVQMQCKAWQNVRERSSCRCKCSAELGENERDREFRVGTNAAQSMAK